MSVTCKDRATTNKTTAVPAEKALKTAHVMALRKIAGKQADAKLRERLEGLIQDLEKESR